MTRIVPVVAIVIAFLVPGSLSGELVMSDRPHQPGQDLFKSTLSEDLAWKPFPAFPPQVRLAVIVGQPSEAGPYTIRVRIPRGVKLMPHRHPEDRVYTVMSGVFYIGLGDRFDPDKLQAYPPGSVIVLPGNTPHFHWAKSSEYVTQVTAIGPSALNTSMRRTIREATAGSAPIEAVQTGARRYQCPMSLRRTAFQVSWHSGWSKPPW